MRVIFLFRSVNKKINNIFVIWKRLIASWKRWKNLLTLINYSCAQSPIGCSDFDHMNAVWYMMKHSERVLIWHLIGCPGNSRWDQGTSDLDLQWDARWKHTGSLCASMQSPTKPLDIHHAFSTCWKGLLNSNTMWDMNESSQEKSQWFVPEMAEDACASGYKRLKAHPAFVYSCHSFGCLYKLVIGHLNNQ